MIERRVLIGASNDRAKEPRRSSENILIRGSAMVTVKLLHSAIDIVAMDRELSSPAKPLSASPLLQCRRVSWIHAIPTQCSAAGGQGDEMFRRLSSPDPSPPLSSRSRFILFPLCTNLDITSTESSPLVSLVVLAPPSSHHHHQHSSSQLSSIFSVASTVVAL